MEAGRREAALQRQIDELRSAAELEKQKRQTSEAQAKAVADLKEAMAAAMKDVAVQRRFETLKVESDGAKRPNAGCGVVDMSRADHGPSRLCRWEPREFNI